MSKHKRPGKKRRSSVRTRDWEQNPDADFSHDLSRHRRAQSKLVQHADVEDPLPTDVPPNAVVVSHSRKWAFVKKTDADPHRQPSADDTLLCKIDERLVEEEESLLAPGDRVFVELEGEDHVVRAIAPRQTSLAKCAGKHGRLERQIIAANVDVLVIVAAATSPPFRPGLVDRFLVVAQQGGVEPVLCLNKIDLVEEEPPEMRFYRELGIGICRTSCVTGEGIAALRDKLTGKTSVLAGHSGVGKSSILNTMDPELKILTQSLSEATRRGRHTTTLSVLYELHDDIHIIDTPGLRALGLWNIEPEEIAFYFPEIAATSMSCKFRNCTHIHEIECAVKEAVEAGSLPRARYESYCRLRSDLDAEKRQP
ncbi:MAG: ribosome small subunit-dependent GTPase A [Candidatus Hydrogenedentales bacterium]|jgi:ribosome biogenesis GTPase